MDDNQTPPMLLRDRFTAEQWDLLLRPLNPERVNERDGNDYLEQWDIRRWLTRIFGFGGWDEESRELACIREHGVEQPNGKWRWWISYRAQTRLTVRDQWGREIGHWDGSAADEKANQPGHGDAHHNAMTSAQSTALKRAAINLGDAFGLSLYVKDRAAKRLPVIGWVAINPPQEKPETAEAVSAPEREQIEDEPTGQDPAAAAEAQADGYAQLVDQARTTDDLGALWKEAKDVGLLSVLLDAPRGAVSLHDYIGAAGARIKADLQEAAEQQAADEAARAEGAA